MHNINTDILHSYKCSTLDVRKAFDVVCLLKACGSVFGFSRQAEFGSGLSDPDPVFLAGRNRIISTNIFTGLYGCSIRCPENSSAFW